ncbi:hypothetical protein DFH28DRAFT_365337 [Melampsora americana]|nr:hypothetical protein DFH28DRAFT_365337 [Melampsora americana]
MSPLVIRDSDDDNFNPPRTTKKSRVSPHESSELSELSNSSTMSQRDALKVTKIVTRDDASDDDEPTYTCVVEGSRKRVKLKESQLEKKMVSVFKKASKTVTIDDSDDDRTKSDNVRSDSKSDTDFDSDDSDEGGKRKRRGGNRASRTSGRNARDNGSSNRRSTRDTRHQGSLKLKDPMSEQLSESESDELESIKVHSTRAQRKNDRDQRKRDRDESEDQTERGISQPRARRSKSPRKIKTKLRVGERPRDEHHELCAKCSGPFEPDLVKNWKKADQQRSGKITIRSLLHKFPTLDDVYDQGCWVDCSDCSTGYHYGCLPLDIRRDIARQHKQEREALLLKEQAESADQRQDTPSASTKGPVMKKEQLPEIRLSIKCPMCIKPHGGECMICGNGLDSAQTTGGKGTSSTAATASAQVKGSPPVLLVGKKPEEPRTDLKSPGSSKTDDEDVDELEIDTSKDQPIFFRCTSCKRPAHYLCLPPSDDVPEDDIDEIAEYWQSDWTCKDCNELEDLNVQYILAWRKPMSMNSSQDHKNFAKSNEKLVGALHSPSKGRKVEKAAKTQLPDVKDPFDAAEYLCKFEDFSFTDCSWVPHSYMAAKHTSKLRNFLTKGPQLDLKQLNGLVDEAEEDDSVDEDQEESLFNLEPDQDAESKIPKAWLTPERILSVEFPNEKLIDDVKEKDIPTTAKGMYDSIERAYIKWEEQAYVSSTWSDKTPEDSPYFPAFMAALEHYVKFRNFVVPTVKHEKQLAKLDAPRPQDSFTAFEKQPEYIPHTLMDFQLDGVNFCYYNWYSRHPTILADEMGLGKTVQICSLIAVLTKVEKRMPFLICVPNSTIGNWVRECAKWLPDLKCVPLPGAADSCEIVEEWELFKTLPRSKPQLAAHVVLATYQAAEKNAAVLSKVQRWEAVIVDEGQRLKAGPKGGLFKALHSMRAGHRILMSGTPLNNNLRELFNLLSFLSPEKYPLDVIDELEQRYQELTPELIEELRNTIRPYMLRRTKETALDLPKLTEIIVPISMRPLQKKVYKGLLSKNVAVITAIYSKKKNKHSKASCMNLLMQLRKALAHPYLNDPEIEPADASDEQTHDNLVEASGKIVFLQKFIPKLLGRGHRILIFSQFTIFLDIMERFLEGEEQSYLRLDGTTSQLDRQTRIDAFNRPNSNYNLFLLSTRAGGAGINLATADTVIILDPDYNPHNDLQAISRAHRFGQKKPVNVFKLMTSASAEERIVQTGKKKLVLDHLVIQKVSEEETEAHDVESILQYGAKELLTASEEALQKDIRYTDEELDELIQRTTEEAKTSETTDPAKKADRTFAFARVWEGRSRGLTSLDKVEAAEANENVQEQRSFWDSVLQANQEEEQSSAVNNKTETGRGYRKRRDVAYVIADLDPSPKKRKTGPSKDDDDDDLKDDEDFQLPQEIYDSSDDEPGAPLPDDEDIVVMSNGTVPADPMAIAAKKAASDEKRKQKWADRYSRMAQGSVDWSPYQMTNQQVPQADATVHLSTSSTHAQAINLAPLALSQNSRPATIPKPKHPKVTKIPTPNFDGLGSAASKRTMDMVLRDIQQKARALRDPALDHLLGSMRGQPSPRQVEIMNEASVLVRKLTRRQARQARAAQQQQAQQQAPPPPKATNHQAQQPAKPMQRPSMHGPPVHPPQRQQQAMGPPFQQPHYRPMYATQPQQSTSTGSPYIPVALPPPRFLDTNPKSIKPYLQNPNLQMSTSGQPWPNMGANPSPMDHRNSMSSSTSSSRTKKSTKEKLPVTQPSGQSSNEHIHKGPQGWGK